MSLASPAERPPRSLRPSPHQEFPLVRRQHPDDGDGRADPGGRRRLADVRRHARPAGARAGRAGRGGAVHRVRALRRPRRRRARPAARRADGAGACCSPARSALARRQRAVLRARAAGARAPLIRASSTRHRRLRRRAQLPAARAQRAGRRPGAARAVSQRGRLARRHLAGRRRRGSGAGRHLLRLGRPDALVRDRRGADGGVAGDRVRASASRRARRPRAAKALVASVREGLAFLFKRPIFMGAITLDLFAVLFGGAVAILPIFAAEILLVGPDRAWARCAPRPRSAPC